MENLISSYGYIPAELRQEVYVLYELGADIPRIREAIDPRRKKKKAFRRPQN